MDTLVHLWPAGEPASAEAKLRMIADVVSKVHPSVEPRLILRAIASCRFTVPPDASVGKFAAEVDDFLSVTLSGDPGT